MFKGKEKKYNVVFASGGGTIAADG